MMFFGHQYMGRLFSDKTRLTNVASSGPRTHLSLEKHDPWGKPRSPIGSIDSWYYRCLYIYNSQLGDIS